MDGKVNDSSTKMLADLPRRASAYVPIGDYAVIGDTLTAALIARDGALDWLCFPNFDSPSWFASMLDAHRGGRCHVGPVGEATTERHYLDGTPILETRHRTEDGVLKVTDFMPLALGGGHSLRPGRRVLRLIEAVEGTPQVALSIAPRPDYARHVPKLRRAGKVGWAVADGRQHLLIQSDIPLEETSPSTVTGRERLKAGERRLLSPVLRRQGAGHCPRDGSGALGRAGPDPALVESMVGDIDYDGPFRDEVHRSLVTLRLLDFSQSGAVIAAPTMGLPETPGGMRNYDYRFCWLRDASFILDAFLSLGCVEEGAGLLSLAAERHAASPTRSCTASTASSAAPTSADQPKSLDGWRSSAPVRLGNAANSQLQLDAYGSIIGAALFYIAPRQGPGPAPRSRACWFRAAGDGRNGPGPTTACGRCRTPAATIPIPRRCAGRRSTADQLSAADGFGVDTGVSWPSATGSAIMCSLPPGTRSGGLYRRPGRDWLDSAVLLLPRSASSTPDDPRMVATYETIHRELGCGPQLYRYTPGVDGLPGREGTFTVCGFWAADYLASAGRCDEAEARIEALLAHANDLGLMSEELDPDSGVLLGNFPQGFSHAGIIGAAIALKRRPGRQTRGGAA